MSLAVARHRGHGVAHHHQAASRQPVCRHWLAGRCLRGNACAYSHPRMPQRAAAQPRRRAGRVCKDFQAQGWCAYGDRCFFEHVSHPAHPVPPMVPRKGGRHPLPQPRAKPATKSTKPRAKPATETPRLTLTHDCVVFRSDAVVEVPIAGSCRALLGAGGETLALLDGTETARVVIRHVPMQLTWDLPSGGLAKLLQRCGAPVPARTSSLGVATMPAAGAAVGDTGKWGTLTFGSAADAAAALAALRGDSNPLGFMRADALPAVVQMPDTKAAKTRPTRVVDAPGAPEVECPVCMDTITPGLGFSVQPCRHVFHKTCLSEMVAAAVEAAKNATDAAFPVSCPGESDDGVPCEHKLCLADLLGALVPPDAHTELVQRSCAAYVQAHAAEWRHCPTPDCKRVFRPARLPHGDGAGAGAGAGAAIGAGVGGGAGAGATAGTTWRCDSCHRAYCLACDDVAFHDGMTCAEYKRSLAEAEERKFNDWVTTRWAVPTNNTRQCPGCSLRLEKMSGCSHVQCIYCRRHFCWACGFTPPGNGAGEVYTHMREAGH